MTFYPAPEQPLWHNEHIYFAAIEAADEQRLANWFSDRAVMEHNVPMVLAPMSTTEAAQRLVKRQMLANQWTWIVVERESHERIGQVSLQILSNEARVARVSILIGSAAYRGRGYGRAALGLMLKFGFRELDLQRIELNVMATNTAAIRTYTGLGFRDEGRLRQAIYRNGERVDWRQMGLLRSEWEAQG